MVKGVFVGGGGMRVVGEVDLEGEKEVKEFR